MHFYIIVLFPIESYSPINKFYSFIIFSVLINAAILLLKCLVLILYLFIHFLSLRCYFSVLKHYLELHITDNALKVSASLYCLYTTSISHGVEIISPGCGARASVMLCYNNICLLLI